ncbi:FAD-dependent oxidoreductase [Clostridium botulinum C]|uniref:Thioredoxin-disulfide reductase n=3 Tax=Clostridium botulinum TaxID=1491 RepID=A0A9Q4Y072_CLOBO|nr:MULTISPECIES: FAD-dependent oxidoreductase [Clostridium]AYF54616.1 thioredoxin-disulfide reductase [Clostridium novyi]EES90653.1 thioredoxin-disulfide reductase [Clostridium botulinum D str. 1873]MBO3442346.1 FAD-dependent oxidoreductase [Clostridium haemolyticum]MCD3194539.1 FAD-dependent oxidoreductase [Clostridium botulinum C]MCD3199693.1 FAD-dependent oxidoreductase [Clostridium botulinum C]
MNKPNKVIDVLIIGSGPAGLTAGIYASRLKFSTLILEDEIIGGQIRNAYKIENYPGFINISGIDLIKNIQEQAIASGCIIDEFDKILSVKLTNDKKIIETQSYIYNAKTVIIASGAKRRQLPIPEENNFHGKGIHYCELCDGHMYEGKHIAIIGGGNSALLAVKFLSMYAEKITIIQQFDYFQAEKKIQEETFNNPKVNIIWNSEVKHAIGDNKISKIVIENIQTNTTSELSVDGIFVYIGFIPSTELYKDYIALDEFGNILADETTKTNVEGVFAAGDVRSKLFRQLTTATADGTVAALMAEKFINKINKE